MDSIRSPFEDNGHYSKFHFIYFFCLVVGRSVEHTPWDSLHNMCLLYTKRCHVWWVFVFPTSVGLLHGLINLELIPYSLATHAIQLWQIKLRIEHWHMLWYSGDLTSEPMTYWNFHWGLIKHYITFNLSCIPLKVCFEWRELVNVKLF